MARSTRLEGLFGDRSQKGVPEESSIVPVLWLLWVLGMDLPLRSCGPGVFCAGTPAPRAQHRPTHGWSQVPMWAFCHRTCWRDRLVSSRPAVPRLAESPGSLFNQMALPRCLLLICAALGRGPGVGSRQAPLVMLDAAAGPGAPPPTCIPLRKVGRIFKTRALGRAHYTVLERGKRHGGLRHFLRVTVFAWTLSALRIKLYPASVRG